MAEKRARSNSPENNGENNDAEKDLVEVNELSDEKSKQAKLVRRIFVSNIPYEVKEDELNEMFKDQIGDVAFLQIFESNDGRSKGIGVIEFTNEESTKKCLEKMHRYNFKGRELVVKEDKEGERDKHGDPIHRGHDGSNFETYGIDSKTLESLNISGPLTNRLFVANIDYKVDERKIKEIFSLCGKINKIWLHKSDDGKPKGTGIIEMSHPIEAVQSIAMLNNQKLYNRELAIRIDKFAQDEDTRFRKFSMPNHIKLPGGLKAINAGIEYEGTPLILSQILGGGVNDDPPIGNFGDYYDNNSNAAMNGSGNQLNTFFNAMMGNMGMGGGNVNNNQQLMTLMTSLMGGAGGGNMMLDPMMQQMMGGGGMLGSITGANSNTSFQGSSASGGTGRTGGSNATSRLLVKNLPSNYKWQDLKDKFREAGEVRYASVSPSKGDSSSSEGLVEFSNIDVARRAIKLLDNTRIGGRIVSVYFQ